jgi:alpha-beta hydrolase superfamily lysophospholipase
MRNIYIAVAVFFLLSIILFISSFVYLDRERHKIYHYIVSEDNTDIGIIRIDRFTTEDKRIYKSSSNIPFYPIFTNSKARLDLDREYGIETYAAENYGNGAKETVYLENEGDGNLAFVAVSQSEFAYLAGMEIKKETFVFAEESPVTYLPIIENYNFQRGRSQGFNAVIPFAKDLPPIKRYVTLTSVRDDYVTIDSHRIKAECLLLKIRNYPPGSVWVSKADHSLIALEIPTKGLRIRRTFSAMPVRAEEHIPKTAGYTANDAEFNNKEIRLSGTLTTPAGMGRYPAVLLLWGAGPADRNYEGLFSSTADYLSRNGFVVLRFDKRGIGSSDGDFLTNTNAAEIADAAAAIDYLARQKEVDPGRIAIIGHGKGALYALQIASGNEKVKTLILISPVLPKGPGMETMVKNLRKMASQFKWSEDYLKVAVRSAQETAEKVKKAKGDWISILGQRCFVKKMKEEEAENALKFVESLKIPAVILQGKEDDPLSLEAASVLADMMKKDNEGDRALVYFGYTGKFLGKRVLDGTHRIYYDTDKEVLVTMKHWLNKTLAEPAPDASVQNTNTFTP